MTKPPTSVRSIRLTDDVWALIAKRAAAENASVNSWVTNAVHRSLAGLSAPPAFKPAVEPVPNDALTRRMTGASPNDRVFNVGGALVVEVPFLERKAFNPQPKKKR